jgi:AraC-like DNA-binding protein
MIRTLILLSPVYISLFWFISLQSNKNNSSVPARFLSFFMLNAAICFFGQYLFFAPYPDIFPFWEPALAYFGSIAFPIYYIYFRLLTVDEKFSLRLHAKYLVVPLLIATVYTVGIFLTPFEQYKAWLYHDHLFADSPQIQFLGVMRKIVKLMFVVLLVITFVLNQLLLKKYAHKAEQYYSDLHDGRFNNAKWLNYFLIFISLSTFVAHIVGRKLLFPSEMILNSIWLIFALSLYGIGYMGFTQKAINPTFEVEDNASESAPTSTELNVSQQMILKKLLDLFENDKIYIDSNLNIMDVVERIGTNRSYLSTIINQQYNQNFCSFVNGFRVTELENVYAANPSISNEHLAEKCGFGSFNSMKRAIVSVTGKSVHEWKKHILLINKPNVHSNA